MTFAERLRQVMRMQGLSSHDLCELTGLVQSHVSHFLTGTREPNLVNFVRIVRALRVPAEMLLPDKDIG